MIIRPRIAVVAGLAAAFLLGACGRSERKTDAPAAVPVVRMTPAEGGGMRLERIAPDSVLGVVGVTQGDVIKAINGINISNMGDAANAMNSLMSGSRFDVTVDRGGKPLELKYQVK